MGSSTGLKVERTGEPVGEPASKPVDTRTATRPTSAPGITPRITLRTSLRTRFLPYLLIILACWSVWLTLTWPGALRDDTLAQYLQSSGLHGYYTQHPLFDTLIFGAFWHLGELFGSPLIGQGIYTLIQAVLLAAGCSLILCYTRKLGVPRWLTLIGLIYCSTSYVMFGSVATMGKDSLHTIFLMPFAVIFVEACLTRGRVLARTPVAVCFVLLGFAVIASKRAALVVVVCAGLLLVAVCAKGLRGRAATCLVAAIVIAECVFAPIAAAVTHANHSVAREVWGYVTQPVARLAHDEPHAISPDQRRRLNEIMDLQRAARTIVDYRTDETFHTLKTDPQPSPGAKLGAVGAWLELGLSHPGTYLKAYAGPIRHWWDITANFAYPTDSDYIFTPGYMRQWSTFLTGPEYAGDAESVAARRLADITRELQPLTGTSRKPQWKADALAGVHRWARHGNPLTSMALYVTWIPLLIALALIGQAVFRKMRARKHLGMCRGAAPVEAAEGVKRTSGAKRAGTIGTTEAAQGGEATESAGTVEVKGSPEVAGDAGVGLALAAFGLLFFSNLSLYAAPSALFWYAIPAFFLLPLFTALPFRPAPRRSVSDAPAPAC